MRTLPTVIGIGAALAAGLVVAAPAGAATIPLSIASGHTVAAGTELSSPNGDYKLVLQTDGELEIMKGTSATWFTASRTTSAKLSVASDGNLMVLSGSSTAIWTTGTYDAGADTLTLTDSGVLTLTASGGTVWSNVLGSGCGKNGYPNFVTVSISKQQARLCQGHSQVLVTPVTTGASSLGDGTPTGTWRVYAKVSPTTLYPAGGGAYHVKYWMPYSGAYGMHDSPWQTFPYGSSLYKTQGSHGCVHFPGAAMTRLYNWAPVGTTVTITP